MDQKLPDSELHMKPGKVFVNLTRSHLPGSRESFYYGTPGKRSTLTIEDIAARIAERGTSYRPQTLIEIYRIMTDEIYDALEHGSFVDMGIAMAQLVVRGRFDSPHARFDGKKHTFEPRFIPSARLKQIIGRIPGEVYTLYPEGTGPKVVSVGILPNPSLRDQDSPLPYDSLPAGYSYPIYFYGHRLKLAGDAPEVGITVRCLGTGEERFLESRFAFINEEGVLGILSPLPLTPGEWQVEVATQHTASYHLYKQPRMGMHTFKVVECPPLP